MALFEGIQESEDKIAHLDDPGLAPVRAKAGQRRGLCAGVAAGVHPVAVDGSPNLGHQLWVVIGARVICIQRDHPLACFSYSGAFSDQQQAKQGVAPERSREVTTLLDSRSRRMALAPLAPMLLPECTTLTLRAFLDL